MTVSKQDDERKSAPLKVMNTVPIKRSKRSRTFDRIDRAVTAPLKDQTRVVTGQQWKFIQAFCDGDGKCSAADAAEIAGYPKSMRSKWGNVLTDVREYPHVVAAIQEYRIQLAEKYGTTFERHMRDLQMIRDKALEAGNFGAAVSAEYRRGQALGSIYIDKKITLTGSIDSMSKEQVKRRLEDMRAMYGKAIPELPELDVTPVSTLGVDEEIVEPESCEEVVEAIVEAKPKPLLEGMRKQEKVRERNDNVKGTKFTDAPPRD